MREPVLTITLTEQLQSNLNDFLKFHRHAQTGKPSEPDVLNGDLVTQTHAVVRAVMFAGDCARARMAKDDAVKL